MKISWNRGIYPQLSSIFFSDFPYIILSTELVLIGAKLLGLGVARHPGWTARRRWSRRWGRRGGKMDDMMRTWHIYVLYTTSMYDMYIYIYVLIAIELFVSLCTKPAWKWCSGLRRSLGTYNVAPTCVRHAGKIRDHGVAFVSFCYNHQHISVSQPTPRKARKFYINWFVHQPDSRYEIYWDISMIYPHRKKHS
jgi:hypothetical protein